MVNSKKNTKSIIALVVLSLLLIASICLAATGAWFTDKKDGSGAKVTFGTVNIQGSDGAVTVAKADAVAMPGDTLKVTGAIKNEGTAKVWVRYKLSHTYAGPNTELKTALDAAFKGDYTYVADAVAAGASADLTKDVIISTNLGNTAQGAIFEVTLVMEAIQWANNETTCEKAFEGETIAARE